MASVRPAGATLACWVVVAAGAHPAGATAAPRIPPRQAIVALLGAHSVRNRPTLEARAVTFIAARRPITGERSVLPVLSQKADNQARTWLRVRLPGRALRGKPPPRTGWIRAANTMGSTTSWHILVDLAARHVVVYRGGRRVRSYPAIVGKHSTPTPPGEYFVEENLQLPANQPGAPFALATSARSNVLQEFDGGPGQIALHGLDHIGGRLGSAVSHGCIRLDDRAITWLAARIRPGIPVSIA